MHTANDNVDEMQKIKDEFRNSWMEASRNLGRNYLTPKTRELYVKDLGVHPLCVDAYVEAKLQARLTKQPDPNIELYKKPPTLPKGFSQRAGAGVETVIQWPHSRFAVQP